MTTRAGAPPRTRGATHPGLRALAAASTVLAVSLVLVLNPQAARVYAADLIGSLRAPGQPAFIAGHRGDRSVAPENTIPAFEAAFAGGLDFVETDVQLTADGQAVLIHDETVDRTTNGTGAVADLTLAQIRRLDAGSWFAPAFAAGTRIPVLGEFLDLLAGAVRSDKKAIIELKGFWSADEVEGILGGIYLRGVQDRVLFASFNLATVENARDAAPSIPRVIIQQHLPKDPVRLAEFYGATAILTAPDALEKAPDAVDRLHRAGVGVLLYTLNTADRWSEALGFGVDGVVTDRPDDLESWRSALPVASGAAR